MLLNAQTKKYRAFAAVCAICIITGLASISAHANIIDHGNYSTIDGIDWLDLTLTEGMSLDDALSAYSSEGWALATESQFDNMYTHFFYFGDPNCRFGVCDAHTILGVSDPVSWYTESGSPNDIITSADYNSDYNQNTFQALFGITETGSEGNLDDVFLYSYGFYQSGEDINLGGMYLFDCPNNAIGAGFCDDEIYLRKPFGATAFAPSGVEGIGFFLTREVVDVPEPSGLALLGIGLFGIFALKRRKFHVKCEFLF